MLYYDNKSGRWNNLSKWDRFPLMNVTLCLPSIVEAYGDLYLAGGKICPIFGNGYNSRAFVRYNVGLNRWCELAPLKVEREPKCGIVHLGNYIYLLGGNERIPDETFPIPIRNAERYNMETNEWESLPDMPSDFYNPSVVVYNNKLLLYGPQRMEPHMGQTTVYNMMMFCPRSLSWMSLWHGEWSSGMIPSTLTVHEDKCYEIRYVDDGHGGHHTRKPHVRLLTLDLEREAPTVEFGDQEDQELTSRYHEVCINGRLFVIVSLENYVHDTGVRLTVDNAYSDEHRSWSRTKDIMGALDKCVASLSIDRLMLK